jgi:hypothetical protein
MNIRDKISRLRAMAESGQQTWDLSPNDVEAVRLAADVLSMIEAADDDHHGHLEMYDVDTDGDNEFLKMLEVGSAEFYGMNALECFEKAGLSWRGVEA